MTAPRLSPLRIAGLYGLVGTAWILTSEALLHRAGPAHASWVGAVNGLAFVACTAALLHVLLRRYTRFLQDSEARYRLLADNVSDVITLLDRTGRLVYVSPAVERLRGVTPEEDLADSPEARLTPASLARTRGALTDLAAAARGAGEQGRPSRTLDLEFRRKDGSTVWTETHISPLRDARGDISGFVAVSRDISERRHAEARLRLQAAALDAAANAIVITDPAGVIQWVNPAFTRLTGYPAELALGQTPRLLKSGEHDAALYAGLWRTILDGRVWTGELVNRRRDGMLYAERQTVTPVRGDDGAITHFIAIKEDVTERRRAEAELERQRERLYQSEKIAAMGQLLSGVAHELNNPLAVVVGRAALLEQRTEGSALARQARSLAQAAERCARIIRSFLDMARRHPPERQRVHPNQVIQDALELMAYGLRADGVEITLDLDSRAPVLWADAHQLHQIVVNLISNAHHALRALPASAPRRLVLRSRSDPAGGGVILEVEDTGPGIPPEIWGRLFEPFFTTKPVGQGTGLGLSLCRGIVEAHGGSIEFDSEPGRGTTFRVRIPPGDPIAGDEAPTPPPALALGRPLRVLVVEDEPAIAETLGEMLILDGHAVDTAADGAVALEHLAGRPYDVVLSDLRMPRVDGPTLYQAIEARFPALRDRVAFLTGDTLAPDVVAFLDRVRRPTLQKPFSLDDVRGLVGRLVADPAGRAPEAGAGG